MAKVERLNDFQNGTRADAEQVDAEFDNLVQAHNELDDEVNQKVSIDGDFRGTWNGVAFEEADPAIAGRVTKVEQMVKEEEPVTITLKRGENLIESSEHVTLTPIEILGDEVKNLALLFDHWTLHANAVTNSPNKITLNAGTAKEVSSLKVDVKRNQDYVYSMKHTGSIAVLDANLSENVIAPYTSEQSIQFNSGNHTSIHIAFKNKNDESGTFTFEGPMLVEGRKEREFVQNYQPIRNPYIEVDNGSSLIFDGYIYKGDKFYQNAKGDWRKKQNTIESLLTPENVKNPTINSSYTGGKAIKIPLNEIAKGIDIFQTEFIKFNRTFLVQTDSAANITNDRYYLDDEHLLLFVSVDDTGWADDYEPTRVDIHAFLLGWKKGTDKWTRLVGGGEITTLPQSTYHGWNPFKLIYHTVSEQDVPAKYEGSLRLSKGTNVVTIGEGIVLREKVNPVLSDGKYHIGNPVVNGSETEFAIDKAIEVVRQGKKDEWELSDHAELDEALYDSNNLYEITYKVKNAYAYTCYVGDAEAVYAPNFHMENNEQVREMQELKNKITQHELAVVGKLGKKNGVTLLGKDGFPLQASGQTAQLKKERIFLFDQETPGLISKDTPNYVHTVNLASYLTTIKTITRVRFRFGSSNSRTNYNQMFRKQTTFISLSINHLIYEVDREMFEQGVRTLRQYFNYENPTYAYINETTVDVNKNPYSDFARSILGAGDYFTFKNIFLDLNDFTLKFRISGDASSNVTTPFKTFFSLLMEVEGY